MQPRSQEPQPMPRHPEHGRHHRAIKALSIVTLATELAVGLSACAPTQTHAEHTTIQKAGETRGVSGEYFKSEPLWVQDFGDDADGKLDATDWNIYTGKAPGNNEAQLYTNSSDNVRIEDGVLRLQARQQAEQGFNFTSSRVDTQGKLSFQYGKFEVVAKIPNGVGSWPAIWLEPSDEKYLHDNPGVKFPNYYVDGEIDIMEAIGSEQNRIYTTVHYLNEDKNTYEKEGSVDLATADTAFHTYAVEWSPNNITFTVDGKIVKSIDKDPSYTYKDWPYNQKYYFILNLALGGDWAGKDTKDFPISGVDTSKLPSSFDIKTVKYFEYVPQK